MKRLVKYLLLKNYPEYYIEKLGYRKLLQYYFFQKILKINSHVPWPTHWSSLVGDPNKIHFKWKGTMPGYMPGSYIQTNSDIYIGRNVWLGPNIKIITGNHDLLDYDKHTLSEPIFIGDNCWLGANVIMLPGSKISNHTIVAAGTIVTGIFDEDNCVIAGSPGKIIKRIDNYKGKVHSD